MADLPSFIDDKILAYLKNQEGIVEKSYALPDTISETDIRAILDGILYGVEKEIVCKTRYSELVTKHHQGPLFDLQQLVPNLYFGKDAHENVAFREALVINKLLPEGKNYKIVPVGGVCLDIQLRVGDVPSYQREPPYDILDLCEKTEEAIKSKDQANTEELQNVFINKLKEYDAFLKDEIIHKSEKFVIHFSSQFNVGMDAGSRITAWVDKKFHTLEEKRTEFIHEDNNEGKLLNQKSLYVALEKEKYYVKYTSNKEDVDERKFYTLVKTKDFVGEGANFVLMRYLAIGRFIGSFELSTMYINGDMCRNIYESKGPFSGLVNGKKFDLIKIYRTVIEECGIKHVCMTLLTLQGQLISQEWEGCKFTLSINPLAILDNDKIYPYTKLSLKADWKNDMQLFSKYLDLKVKRESQIKCYLKDHKEVKAIISDFVQNILLLKPQDVLKFAVYYFRNFQPFNIVESPYFTGTDSDIFYK